MATDLALLIDYYEAEKKSIEEMIKDNLVYENYFDAYQNKIALNLIYQELEVLYRLRDPNYVQKKDLRFNLTTRQRLVESIEQNHSYESSYLQNLVKEYRADEQQLNQLENTIPFLIDDQQLDDAIFDLIEGKIRSFKLYIDFDNNIYFQFGASEDHLRISLDLNKIAGHTIYRAYQNKLLKYGFKINSESATYTLNIPH